MRTIFLVVLVIGLGVAGFAVYMAQGYIGSYESQLAQERAARAPEVELTEVMVVDIRVAYGDIITKEKVRNVRWPVDSVPAGAFTSMTDLFPEGEKEFRTALRTVEKDEAILRVKFSEPGEGAGVASQLASGMRAMALRVDVSSGVSGFLRPGDRVDVYWTGNGVMTDDGVTEQGVTKLIKAGVLIIGIDQVADIESKDPKVARTVTVAVTPREVAALAQAQASGIITLSLIGVHDADTDAARKLEGVEVGVREIQEFGMSDGKCVIRTRKAGELVSETIPCPE